MHRKRTKSVSSWLGGWSAATAFFELKVANSWRNQLLSWSPHFDVRDKPAGRLAKGGIVRIQQWDYLFGFDMTAWHLVQGNEHSSL